MINVSDVKFGPDGTKGTCPVCGRGGRSLGRCNADLGDPDVRCIDCFFSPVPMDQWIKCSQCGLLQPGEYGAECDDCKQKL